MKNKHTKRRICLALGLALSLAAGTLASAIPTQAAADATINKVKDFYAIQTKVKLTGSGTGYHAKIAYVNPESAISYGIQHDEFASAPYTGKDELMVENVYSNDPGMQRYDWLNVTLNPGQTYTLMLTLSKTGDATVYLDGKPLKSYHTEGLRSYNGPDSQKYNANPQARIEGSARKNGDTVDVSFNDIHLKEGSFRDLNKYKSTNIHVDQNKKYAFFLPHKEITNPTLKIAQKKNTVRIFGSISGLADDKDWDSDYSHVSGVMQFHRNAPYFPPAGHPDHK